MDPTAEELWAVLMEHCGACYRYCQNERNAKAIYERLERMQQIAKEIVSKS